jgi:hypothetical protein
MVSASDAGTQHDIGGDREVGKVQERVSDLHPTRRMGVLGLRDRTSGSHWGVVDKLDLLTECEMVGFTYSITNVQKRIQIIDRECKYEDVSYLEAEGTQTLRIR